MIRQTRSAIASALLLDVSHCHGFGLMLYAYLSKMVNGFLLKLEDKKVKLLSIDGGAQCSLMQRSHPRLTALFFIIISCTAPMGTKT